MNNALRHKIKMANQFLKVDPRYHHTPHVSKYRELLTSQKGIFFVGGVGTGKTYEITTLRKNLYTTEMVYVKQYVATELAGDVRASVSQGLVEQVLDSLQREEYLCIDDLGTEMMTDFYRSFFYDLINHRYNNILPCIFASNLDLEKLADFYGQRIVSRFTEMFNFVELNSEDKRLNL